MPSTKRLYQMILIDTKTWSYIKVWRQKIPKTVTGHAKKLEISFLKLVHQFTEISVFPVISRVSNFFGSKILGSQFLNTDSVCEFFEKHISENLSKFTAKTIWTCVSSRGPNPILSCSFCFRFFNIMPWYAVYIFAYFSESAVSFDKIC